MKTLASGCLLIAASGLLFYISLPTEPPARAASAAGSGGGGGTPAVCTTLSGDVNGDGRRDISDAVHTLTWLFSGGPEPVPFCERRCIVVLPGSLKVTGSCMPPVVADPFTLTFEATVVNLSAAQVGVRIVSATLEAGGRTAPIQTDFLVEPQEVEVPFGEPVILTFRKVAFARQPDCSICDTTATIRVEYLVDGVLQDAPLRFQRTAVECTF